MSLLWDDKEEEQSSACYTTGDRLLLLLAHRQDGPLGEEREQGREEEDPWRGDSGGKEEWHHDARFLLLFLFLLWWLKSSYRHLPELSPESEGPGRGLVLHSGQVVWAGRRFPPLSHARSKVSSERSPVQSLNCLLEGGPADPHQDWRSVEWEAGGCRWDHQKEVLYVRKSW